MEPIFSQLVLDNQQMMATPERREQMLALVPPGTLSSISISLLNTNYPYRGAKPA
jgi:hypothetical protein